MTAKLILSILFLLLILEILPKRSEAIANGPGQACKGNSRLCWETGLMEDDKGFPEDVFAKTKRRICDTALRMGCGQPGRLSRNNQHQ
ncbi:unnamed protein product [Pocillopora meandrina]|uniref:Uncharacterized protein n=1 Tax=Pocillopora meandrina TaxID=46732 RepID=A0AAU9WIJ2_9CNID|nr:unnamed protein product [Pocillopora meandrina]